MTLSEMKKLSILPPEEKQRMLREFESAISSKKTEWQDYNTIVRNSLGNVASVKDLNPSLEHLNILRAEIANLEAELQQIGKYIDRRENEYYGDDDDDCGDTNEPPDIDQQAIARAVARQGIINIRPDVKKFQPASRALTYKQILDKEAKEEACEKRDDIKEIIREILNHGHK